MTPTCSRFRRAAAALRFAGRGGALGEPALELGHAPLEPCHDAPKRRSWNTRGGEKGTGPICRNGPEGAAHKLDLSPFSPPRTARHPQLKGEVRLPQNSRSSLYNTDGQISPTPAFPPCCLWKLRHQPSRLPRHARHDGQHRPGLRLGPGRDCHRDGRPRGPLAPRQAKISLECGDLSPLSGVLAGVAMRRTSPENRQATSLGRAESGDKIAALQKFACLRASRDYSWAGRVGAECMTLARSASEGNSLCCHRLRFGLVSRHE